MADVFRILESRQHYNRQRRQLLVEFPNEVESTDARQCQIQQHQVQVGILGSHGKALLTIARRHHSDVVREGFEGC